MFKQIEQWIRNKKYPNHDIHKKFLKSRLNMKRLDYLDDPSSKLLTKKERLKILSDCLYFFDNPDPLLEVMHPKKIKKLLDQEISEMNIKAMQDNMDAGRPVRHRIFF